MKPPKKFNLSKFLILSLLIHLIAVQVAGRTVTADKRTKAPIRVKVVEAKVEVFPDETVGEIVDLPEPPKIEKPLTKKRFSEYNSRAHGNRNDLKRERYRSSETISPRKKSKPRSLARKKKIYKKRKFEKKEVKKKQVNKKNDEKILVAKRSVKKVDPEKTNAPLMALKGLFKEQKEPGKDNEVNENPLFKGFDPEKYAKLTTGAFEDDADTETVSLDSQELKFASYFSTIKRQIENIWDYPKEATSKGLQGQLLMQFIIDRDGNLVDIALINTSGHEILDAAALNAVRSASPYKPFPDQISKKRLRIIASFTYTPSYAAYR